MNTIGEYADIIFFVAITNNESAWQISNIENVPIAWTGQNAAQYLLQHLVAVF